MFSILSILYNSFKGRKLWEEYEKEFYTFCRKLLSYKYLKLKEDKKLNKFVFDKAMGFCKNNNIPVYELPDEILNKNKKEDDRICGCFCYLKDGKTREEYNKIFETYKRLYPNDKDRTLDHPRIEIRDDHRQKNYFNVLIHEIGHWYQYENNIEQSEYEADAYIEKFFKDNLPEFFQWVFQITIAVSVQRKHKKYKRNFSTYEAFVYYNQCLNFLKEH